MLGMESGYVYAVVAGKRGQEQTNPLNPSNALCMQMTNKKYEKKREMYG